MDGKPKHVSRTKCFIAIKDHILTIEFRSDTNSSVTMWVVIFLETGGKCAKLCNIYRIGQLTI